MVTTSHLKITIVKIWVVPYLQKEWGYYKMTHIIYIIDVHYPMYLVSFTFQYFETNIEEISRAYSEKHCETSKVLSQISIVKI